MHLNSSLCSSSASCALDIRDKINDSLQRRSGPEDLGNACRPLLQKKPVSLVRLFRWPEASQLAVGPRAPPVHRWMDSADKGLNPGEPQVAKIIHG